MSVFWLNGQLCKTPCQCIDSNIITAWIRRSIVYLSLICLIEYCLNYHDGLWIVCRIKAYLLMGCLFMSLHRREYKIGELLGNRLNVCEWIVSWLIVPLLVNGQLVSFISLNCLTKNNMRLGGSPGLVVMGWDSCSEGCGFKSHHYTLDRHFHIYLSVKIVVFVWKEENEWKDAGDYCPFKQRIIWIDDLPIDDSCQSPLLKSQRNSIISSAILSRYIVFFSQ